MASNQHNKKAFENFVNNAVKNNMLTKGTEITLTWLAPDLLKILEKDGYMPQTPVVVIQDKKIGHLIGDRDKITKKQLCNIYNIEHAEELIKKR